MMRINYIYQEILAKIVEVKYINTHNQVADIFTKPLALEQYAVLSNRLLRGFNGVPVTHESNLYVLGKVRAKTLEAEPEENI
jgi:hemin uptake protein HemP